ncbi:hypothetical protein GGX14DRAFT_405437 [Mycena pura]|uniref:RNase H type-1 domain-containing protein n=1 Tax=Mycena pura TaxID=153505 RepID=A0AAD6Y494_9AGAR|nr:hypothetical protein GGX14DRAFT_405437 [Mycena pura]
MTQAQSRSRQCLRLFNWLHLKEEDGLERKDLDVPMESDLDEDLYRLMNNTIEEGELATRTYGAVVATDIRPRQVYVDGSCQGRSARLAGAGPVIAQTGWACANGDVLRAIHFRLCQRHGRVVFHHVRAHAGNKENDEADRLAKEGTRLCFENEVLNWLEVPSPLPGPPQMQRTGPCRVSTTLLRPEIESGPLWKLLNKTRCRNSGGKPSVGLEEQTRTYQRRMNPHQDPAEAGFDLEELARVVAAAAEIPNTSPLSRYPELNEMPTIEDLERAKAKWRDAGKDGHLALMITPNRTSCIPIMSISSRKRVNGFSNAMYLAHFSKFSSQYPKTRQGPHKGGKLPRNWSAELRLQTAINYLHHEAHCGTGERKAHSSHAERIPSWILHEQQSVHLADNLGLTGPWFNFIRMIYRETKAGGLVSEEWISLCGVLMGDPISPTLWNIFLSTFEGPEAGDVPRECLNLNGEPFPWMEEYKYVRVWFTSVTRDIFHGHYERKRGSAGYVFWKTVLSCDHFVGRGRLPPDIGCQLYYALIDCHLTHGCDVTLDVDSTSFELLDGLNRVMLRRILGVGKRSGIVQLYSELGIYPLRSPPAKKALQVADTLRHDSYSSWMGDLAYVLNDLPFDMPSLPRLPALTVSIRVWAHRWVWERVQDTISLPLLHGRLELREEGPSRVIHLCRRHYLSRVEVTDHRLALTRLLCASYCLRGVRTDPTAHPREQLVCRKCGVDYETPGHVFMQCRAVETVAARSELQQSLSGMNRVLPHTYTRETSEALMRRLIFDWDTVKPMARFVFKVVRSWKWFGRRLPTMVCEVTPDTETKEEVGIRDFESATEDGSVDNDMDMMMDIDF